MKLVHLSTMNVAQGRDTFLADFEYGPSRVTVGGTVINGSVYADRLYVCGNRGIRVDGVYGIPAPARDLIIRHPRIVDIFRAHAR